MASPVLAPAPRECCTRTVQHTGTATGSFEVLANVNTYLARSPSNDGQDKHSRIIFFFPDVFGPLYINNQLLIDYFASNGYLVVAPDYFEGDIFDQIRSQPGFDLFDWATKKLTRGKEIIPGWIKAIKAKYGYCFGAPFTLEAAATDLVVAAAIAHPSFLNEDHFKNVKKPLFLSCAEVDQQFPLESRHRAETILAENKAVYHFQLFGGVSHGFAVKGDPDVPNEKFAKEESARSIIRWFDRFSK
ncbi:Alpha/Beta hydrolase protein [Multifurca ochricompacta]|uniref:Alpha/Beta hydrolase protein n=1 Tax=Multifurca ochricompacta TaxID=376703 RepID=A0AAD4LTU2_9AGAM|nr:Alpha/Beta hydrolase protein [Multifurca ochricompacta]